MKVGLTDCLREDKLQQYVDWIRSLDPTCEVLKLSSTDHNAGDVDRVDGLLLTGGGDIDPDFYGRRQLRNLAKDISVERDKFEFDVIRRALDRDLPILGVCRGMQVMNVALGGSLHVDLQSDGFHNHSSSGNGGLSHEVRVEPNSLLSGLAGGLEQVVNSYHHQGVDVPGNGLMPVARSADGVIEAAEWSSKEGMPFLLLVQWHPERSMGSHDTFSKNLAKIFLREIQITASNKVTDTSRR